jgi:hypothetical protein
MFFLPCRIINAIPIREPDNTPRNRFKMVSRQPRYAPTINIIFTSPSPIASTPRSFSQAQPINQSDPPPTNAPTTAPISEAAQSGIPASIPFISIGRSSKCGRPVSKGIARRAMRANTIPG